MWQAQIMDDEMPEATPEIYVPTQEDLEAWLWDSGCESACEHAAWVEHDGHCPECGAPSWFLKLGLI